jgi:hypothetical protein
MMSTNPKHWSRAWFNIGSNCDSVDNNMCESFNNWIVDIRAHPILSMLEGIRTKVYVRIQQNRAKSAKWNSRICPNIMKKLNKYINLAQNCTAVWKMDMRLETRTGGTQLILVQGLVLAGIGNCQAFLAIMPPLQYT